MDLQWLMKKISSPGQHYTVAQEKNKEINALVERGHVGYRPCFYKKLKYVRTTLQVSDPINNMPPVHY